MNRKLLVLDVVLAGGLVYAGVEFYAARQAARAHQQAVLNQRVKPFPKPPFEAMPQPAPVLATGYARIAQKDLLDKSRNPEVVIEVAPPPPPVPQPPLPVYYGMLNLGDGVTAFMSEKSGMPQQAVHPGDKIGPYKLVSVGGNEIVLEWDGKQLHKTVNELLNTSAPTEVSDARQPKAVAAPPPPPVVKTEVGPGQDTDRGYKLCAANDSYPNGAVVDGYRKSVTRNPFGESCRWDPVGR